MIPPDGSQPATPARQRARLLAWLLIAANVGLGAAYAGLFVVLVLAGKTRGADFTAFYTGWKTVLEGHGSQLYDPALQAEVQRRVLEGQTFEGGFAAFVNPPHMVLPYTPLGLLPLDAAYLAWAGVQALLLVAIVAMLLRGVAREWTRVERLGLVASLVAFPAVAMAFYQGAFALVLVASVLAALAAMDQRRDARAGGLLALASVKPQGMFGMGIAVLLARRPAALAALVGWGLGLVVLATAVLGPGIWASYLRFLGTYASSFDRLSANPSVMWNLRGTLALLLGRDSAATVDAVAYAGFAVGIVAIAFLWRRGWSRGGDRAGDRGGDRAGDRGGDRAGVDGTIGLRIALTIVLTLLLSPHLNPHDDALAIVAVALAYGSLRGTTAGRAIGIGALLTPVAIVVVNGITADAPTTLPIRLPTVLLVALGFLVLASLRRRQA